MNAAGTGPATTSVFAADGGPRTGNAGVQVTRTPVRHVVVIYLENHSFDNVLGYWCGEHRGRCPEGGMPARVRLSDGAVVTPGVDPDTVPLVAHSVGAQLAAMHIVAGVPQMNGWQNVVSSTGGSCDAAASYRCISGYQPGQIPNLTTLASDFAISDNTFSMSDSPSWGGHLYAVLGSLDGFLGNIPGPGAPARGLGCNSHLVTQWVSPAGATKLIPSCVPDYALNRARYPYGGAFEATPAKWEPSILDRLDAAGLSWKIYDGGHQPATDGWAICPSLADCWYTSQAQRMTSMSQFRADAAAGTLPDFSIIIPGNIDEEYSQHNGTSMIAGDNWTGHLVSAIMHGPSWSSTAVFITYDDCGCFYDQAVPRRNPDGTWQGPRTPLVIISPYARPG
ncbi:MAG TPA: alkaline phosphatase family protein, partial [Streptosporangiaceae bacterium]|nr:alkaline phosphatase family protein [Streptosporangiaceae bacterium]